MSRVKRRSEFGWKDQPTHGPCTLAILTRAEHQSCSVTMDEDVSQGMHRSMHPPSSSTYILYTVMYKSYKKVFTRSSKYLLAVSTSIPTDI